MAAWWGTRANVSARLRLEVEAMRAAFDNTFKLVVPPIGLLYWEGTVDINLSTLSQTEHRLKIVYPNEYPNRPAEAVALLECARRADPLDHASSERIWEAISRSAPIWWVSESTLSKRRSSRIRSTKWSTTDWP